MIDVMDALRLALMEGLPQASHGQLCPVWTKRAHKPPPWAECDCWRREDVAVRAAIVAESLHRQGFSIKAR